MGSALGNAENGSRSAKLEKWTRHARYSRKRDRERKILKLDSVPSVPPKTGPVRKTIKLDPTLGTAENGFGSAKLDPMRSVKPKMGPGVQSMKPRPDVHDNVENRSESAEPENWTRRARYSRKRVRESVTWKLDPMLEVTPKTGLGAQNMKTGPGALGTAEKRSGSAKHENWTQGAGYQ
jgi:hypothetical protein